MWEIIRFASCSEVNIANYFRDIRGGNRNGAMISELLLQKWEEDKKENREEAELVRVAENPGSCKWRVIGKLGIELTVKCSISYKQISSRCSKLYCLTQKHVSQRSSNGKFRVEQRRKKLHLCPIESEKNAEEFQSWTTISYCPKCNSNSVYMKRKKLGKCN